MARTIAPPPLNSLARIFEHVHAHVKVMTPVGVGRLEVRLKERGDMVGIDCLVGEQPQRLPDPTAIAESPDVPTAMDQTGRTNSLVRKRAHRRKNFDVAEA